MMSDLVELVEAMEKQPDPPCIGCSLFHKCAEQQLACKHFGQYVGSAADPDITTVYVGERSPTRYMYAAIHADDTPGPKGPVTPLATLKAILADETRTHNQLAKDFNVSTSTVRRAKAGYYDDHFV